MAEMTPYQIDLGRHALGLSRSTKSFRNRFVAGPGHDDYDDWMQMVADGNATRRDGKKLPFGGDDLFTVTLKGARQALRKGETLDGEDFPEVGNG